MLWKPAVVSYWILKKLYSQHFYDFNKPKLKRHTKVSFHEVIVKSFLFIASLEASKSSLNRSPVSTNANSLNR